MHRKYMQLALDNARMMRGQTDPNPTVGCVLVKDGRVVGIGSHLKAGGPHAEVHALRMAGEEAAGSTAYVTLEPCSHTGKTGPCAIALIKAGVKHVVIAALDPNPLVAGNGVRLLEEAGISVETGVCEQESLRLNDVFNYSITRQLPFVTLKTAVSLDGKIATKTGSSKWVTSAEARKEVHQLRSEHQAILVGVETVLKDDPSLTARIPNGRNPIRIIVDSNLRTPLHAKIVCDQEAPTWIFTAAHPENESKRTSLEQLGVRVIATTNEKQVSVREVMVYLYKQAISSVLLEAGGTLNAALIKEQLVQKFFIYFAPKLVGGRGAPTFFEGLGIKDMGEAIEVEIGSVEKVGPDWRVTAYPLYK
nr:bifunctional diaminohydroxyphosphoribosylaminopyrimidine deaminase/5-amino-6-(5-phosphoribosylamino)uracil reductase RibD [Shouchella patagoniensis]